MQKELYKPWALNLEKQIELNLTFVLTKLDHICLTVDSFSIWKAKIQYEKYNMISNEDQIRNGYYQN